MKRTYWIIAVVPLAIALFIAIRSTRTGPSLPRTQEEHPIPNRGADAKGHDAAQESPRTGRISVRVFDLSVGSHLQEFRCAFKVQEQEEFDAAAMEGRLEQPIRISEGHSTAAVCVRLVEPGCSSPPAADAFVGPNDEVVLELVARSGSAVKGLVVGPAGEEVIDAVVFFGPQSRGRGDEPFRGFRPNLIKDGARTDADGGFTLEGPGDVITIWHPEYSPITVRASEARRVKLEPRSMLRGRVLDDHGKPSSNIEVSLDRDRKTTTNSDGRFSFDRVELGVRGLSVLGRRYAVQFLVGENPEVDLSPGLSEVNVDVSAYPGVEIRAALVGLDRVSSVLELRGSPPYVVGNRVLPGSYVLLAESGHLAFLTIADKWSVADFGQGALEITADTPRRVHVTPRATSELVDIVLWRLASYSGWGKTPTRLSPWPVGHFEIRGADRQLIQMVEVQRPETRVHLK